MSTPESNFFAPVFTAEQIQAARMVLDAFNHYDDSEGEEERGEVAKSLPEYSIGKAAVPSLMAFCFPKATYGNEDVDPSSIDQPVGDACIMVFDPSPDADIDLYIRDLISEEMDALNTDAMDEYHFEFNDQTRTVRECVQDLLNLGLRYEPAGAPGQDESCAFEEILRKEGAMNPKPKPDSSSPRPKI